MADGVARQMSHPRTYGAGVVGNCCTHGAYAARTLAEHPRTRLITDYEADSRRGLELAEAMGCQAIDYLVTLFGLPQTVQAKRADFWGPHCLLALAIALLSPDGRR